MAKQTKKNEKIIKDDSTISEKYDSLIKASIAKRTRNTFRQKILTLENDSEYLRLLLKPKYRYSTRTDENLEWKQKVLTDYFKDNEKNLYVMQSNYSLQQHYAMIGEKIKKYPDMSVSMYVAINDGLREENGRKNSTITTSEMILLSRFDPGQKFDHLNRIDKNSLKFEYFGKLIEPGISHFHYASRTQALVYNDTADCDAISLDNLIKYILDLKKSRPRPELMFDNLSMPYLNIKHNPELYQTNSKILKLGDTIPKNYLIKKSFIFGAIDKRADLFGLDAVLFDLILLRGLVRLCQEEKNSNCYNNYSALLYETTITLASKITSAGLSEDLNNDLLNLVNSMEEVGMNRKREF